MDLATGETDASCGFVVRERGVFVENADEVEALGIANGDRASADGVEGLLQELIGEDTSHGLGTTHRRPPGFLASHLLLAKLRENHDIICETDH